MADLTDTSTQTDVPAQPQGGLSIAAPVTFTGGGKGQLATMVPAKGMLMDPESSKAILAKMEEMLKEKPMEKFERELQGMHAWTKYDKEPMFKQLAEQDQQRRAERYNIGQSMAALQSSQGQLQKQALSLLSPQAQAQLTGQPSVPGMGAPAATSGPITPEIQTEIDRLILEEKNVAAAQALRKKAYDEHIAARSKLQYSADMNAPVEFMNPLTNKPDQMTRGMWAEYSKNRPDLINLIRQANPGIETKIASTPTPSGAGLSPTDLANQVKKDFGIDLGPAALTRTPEQQYELIARHAAGEKGIYKPSPWVEGKQSYHENSIDVPQTVPESYMNQRGWMRPDPKGDPVHYVPISTAKAELAVSSKAPPAGSKQEFESGVKQQENIQQSWLKGTYEPLQAVVVAQKRDEQNAQIVLDSLKNNKFGPGTSLNQEISKYLQMAGLKLSPQETEKYISNLNISRAQQLFAEAGARAALGAQYTQAEGESHKKTLASIDDPKEYIRYIYELQLADARINKAHLAYLNKNKSNMMEAEDNWEKSGERERIMKETITPPKSVKKTAATAETKTAQKQTAPDAAINLLKQNPNPQMKKFFQNKYGYLPEGI